VLLVASAFFPKETVLLLCLCLGSDLILVWYFWVKKPCTAPLLNTVALIAFGFSAWLNIASLIVVWVGDDSAPSIMMFCYVVCVFFLVIYGLQVVYFPLDEYKHLNKLEGPERMQLAISMRTEVALRLMNLLTDAEFWTDVVVKSQPAAWKNWTVSGLVVTAIFFLNCAHAGFSTIYFGGMHFLAWYVSPGKSSWFDLLPARQKRFITAVGAEMRRRKRRRMKARKEKMDGKKTCSEPVPTEMADLGEVIVDVPAEGATDKVISQEAAGGVKHKVFVAWQRCTDFVCMAGDLVLVVCEVLAKADEIASTIDKAKDDAEAGEAEEDDENEGDDNESEGSGAEDGDDEGGDDAFKDASAAAEGAGAEGGDDADANKETSPLMKEAGVGETDRSCCAKISGWFGQRRVAMRSWLKKQAAAAAHVRLATFILRSTVAMVVFDVVDIVITLVYDDEEEGPITKTAVLSTLFSAASAAYGLIGRKRDLKVRANVHLLSQNMTGGLIVNVPLNCPTGDQEAATAGSQSGR
jgi:hypothetical protein